MTTATIRLAVAEDFDTIAAITNDYIRRTTVHFATAPVAAQALRADWQEQQQTYPWLVTEIAGAVLGFAKAGVYRTRAAYRWTTETGIYLDADHCGQGLGEPLYRTLLAVLRAQGFHSAIGGIALPNPASVRLHERLGFVPIGAVRRAGRKFDRWVDVGFWQRELQSPAHEPAPVLPPTIAFAAIRGV